MTEGLRSALEAGTGRGVRIGILDTGVASDLPHLEGSVAANFEVEMRVETPEIVSYHRGEDVIGHGTANAWLIHHFAPDSTLYNVRVIGRTPRDTSSKLLAGLEFAIGQGWDILNLSLGTEASRSALHELVIEAHRKGILMIAAKDNHPDRMGYPAAFPEVIGVDMEHFDDPFEIRFDPEREIEVEARGIYVEAPRPDGSWHHFTGTSFACPHVTAIAARLREANPRLNHADLKVALAELSKFASATGTFENAVP
jgi:subtilisin family serine protease